MTDTQTADINRALDNHDHLRNSYFWSPASNASGRLYNDKMYTFKIEVVHEGHVYVYYSNVQCSVRNFYDTGRFCKNGKKGAVRLFMKLWKTGWRCISSSG